jgi:hypothetical protein
VRATIHACDWAPAQPTTVTDRAELVERDELEALRRRPGAPGSSQAVPVADDPTIEILPAQSRRTGPGSSPAVLPRAMGPASFMAMQRLAGNRAMLQALARAQVSLLRDTADPEQEEEKPAGGASPAELLALPGQAGAAAGAPNGTAGSGQQGGAGDGTAAGGSAEPSTQGGRGRNSKELEKPALSSTGDAAAAAGQAGATGATTAGEAAGAAAVGAAGAGAAGESAGAAAGTAVGGGSGAAAGAPAGVAIGGASGSGASAGGGSTDIAAGADAPGGGAAGSSRSRRTEPPPITGSGGPSAPRAGSGPSTGSGGVPAGGGPGQAGGGPGQAGGGPGQAGSGPGPATTLDATGSGPPSPISAAPAAAAGGNGTSGVTDPTTAKTGIDWNQMLSDFGPPARTVLEVGRLIPGWGLLAGLASDSLSWASDMNSIPASKNARFATDLVIFRNIVNILNNGLGHVLYVDQLIQDGLAGSVVGAEFTPFTAATNELLAGIKVALDEVQLGTDVIVEVEALYQANHAPDSTEADAWRALADNYAANILGDVVNTILDLISLSSAGAANTAPVEEAKLPLTLAGAFLEHAAPNIISAINNVVGVWLGTGLSAGRHAATGTPATGGAGAGPAAGAASVPGGPAPAPGAAGPGAGTKVQRIMAGQPGDTSGTGGHAAGLQAQAASYDMAGGFIDIEAPQARATYDGMNLVIGAFEAYAEDQVAQIDAVVGALSGGKSAFQVIRDAVKAGLDDMNAKLGMAQQLGETATNAKANAASISAACTTVLSGIDGLVMPSVRIPSVDLGDGVLADAAAAVANTAAEAANVALELAISGVSAALDTAKDAIRSPILDLKSHADSLGEWLAILATKCTEMVATLHSHIASFSEGLGHCNNVEDVINLIIGQVSEMTGMPRVTVQDLRDTWDSVGPYIDQFAALGPQLHDRAAALRAQAAELGAEGEGSPTFALPPGPPPDADAGAGAGMGASA